MKGLVIFDSDFIIANIASLENYLSKYKEYDCFTTEVNLEEVAKNTSLEKIDLINNFKLKVKNYKRLGITFENDDESTKKIIEEDSKHFLKDFFKNNIIRNHSRKSELLIERACNKIPPFGKSDTGFKDTIILLDIIDYLKGKKIEKAFFVTNDDDFIKNKDAISKEVNEKTNCEFIIVDGRNPEKLLHYFKINSSDELDSFEETVKDDKHDIRELRDDLKEIRNKLFHFVGYDPYSFDGEYVGDTFKTTRVITKEEIGQFLDNLSNNIKKNIFNTSLVMSDFFDNPFLFKNESAIDIEVFEKLNEVYLKIKDNTEHKNALLNLLYSEFYQLKEKQYKSSTDNEELPF